MSFEFNFDELNKLAADIAAAPEKSRPGIRKAVEVTARYVKDDWRKGAKRSGLSAYPTSIDYDINSNWSTNRSSDNEISAEIGPNMAKRQGKFGFVEDANGDVRSAPQHAGRKALKKNEEDFVKGLEIAIGKIL